MTLQYQVVCNAIRAFGGDSDPAALFYWTRTTYESDSSEAWFFYLGDGWVNVNAKDNNSEVRAVSAI